MRIKCLLIIVLGIQIFISQGYTIDNQIGSIKYENLLLDNYRETYKKEIILKLPQRIVEDISEYENASDTEKAIYYWLEKGGMPIGSEIREYYKSLDTKELGFQKLYSLFPYFGVDDTENIYIMPENLEMIRKYDSKGKYITTVYKDDNQYNDWFKIVTKFLYNKTRKYRINDRKRYITKGEIEVRTREVFNLKELGSNEDTAILLEDVYYRLSEENKFFFAGAFLDIIDEENNLYQIVGVEDNLAYNSQNKLTYINDRNPLQRIFLIKYNREGELLTEIELLPSYIRPHLWKNPGGHNYLKVIDSKMFYVIGITYLEKKMDLYIFKYSME